MSGFTYLTPVIPDPNWQKFVVGAALCGVLVLTGKLLTVRLATDKGFEGAVIPDKKLTPFGFFDFFIEAFLAHHDSVLGKENRKYVPLTGSLFIFILFANLLGLVPGMPAITTTVWINVGMALLVFIYFNYLGIKEQGLINYLKHFCGPVWWLAFLILPIELLSTCLRILTLNLRLYWNISADHMVLEAFTGMIGIGAVPFYVMGTFVSFMQAFIFTTLTMVYILLATQHEEHEEGEH
ncbi:MAG: F0F1 ATP synthase subunit A [Oligoflexia bacterium]|nr:F0F1 ATP synthase subunit A [Oligoflexia bacterium]